ncbi:MAG: LCP family protein [bacterium]
MRLTTTIVFSLTFILITGSLVFFWFPPEKNDVAQPGINLSRLLTSRRRIKGVLVHKQQDKPVLFYLVGYEPITQRNSWIYLPPEATVMSPTLGRETDLGHLYSDLSERGFLTELEDIFNLKLSFHVTTANNQLEQIVDLMGGISIPFEKIPDNLSAPPRRWLDGALTQDFAANAYDNQGIDGLRYRHKTVLLGIINRLKNNPNLLDKKQVIQAVYNQLKTNLSPDEFNLLLRLIAKLEKEKIKFLTALITDNENQLETERVVNMLPPPVKKIIDSSSRQDVIKIQILNGTSKSGMASKYRQKLQPLEFVDVVEIGNADRYNYQESRFIDRSNQPQSAWRLKQLLGKGSLEIDPSAELLVDVTFIIGEDLVEIPNINENL